MCIDSASICDTNYLASKVQQDLYYPKPNILNGIGGRDTIRFEAK